MKRLLLIAICIPALLRLVEAQPVPTTPFTRSLLLQTNAEAVKRRLGISTNVLESNAVLQAWSAIDPTNKSDRVHIHDAGNLVTGTIDPARLPDNYPANLESLQVTSLVVSNGGIQMGPGSTYTDDGSQLLRNGVPAGLDVVKVAPIYTTTFTGTSLPAGWITQGTWTVSGGLNTPASGTWNYAYCSSNLTTLDDQVLTAIIRPVTESCVVGVAKFDSTLNAVGTVLLLDGANGTLAFYGPWTGTNTPTLAASVSLPFTLDTTHSYLLLLSKTDAGHFVGQVKDMASGVSTNLSAVRPAVYVGNGWDAPAVVHVSGSAKFHGLMLATRHPRSPRLGVLGDSFTEGDSVSPNFTQRWTALASARLGGDVAVAGRGGESSGSVSTRLTSDLHYFSSAYQIIGLGANDVDFETWKANTLSISNQVVAKGSIPIFITFAPRADRQEFLNQANAWTLTNGCRYVDFGAVLTTGGDRVTWNPVYSLGDGIHPNLAGHAAMYAQLQADVPEIFQDYKRQEYGDLPGVSVAGSAIKLTKGLNIVTPAGQKAITLENAGGVNRVEAAPGQYLILDSGGPGTSIGHYDSGPVRFGVGGGQVTFGTTPLLEVAAGRYNFRDGGITIGATDDAGEGGLYMTGLLKVKNTNSLIAQFLRNIDGFPGLSLIEDSLNTYLRTDYAPTLRLTHNTNSAFDFRFSGDGLGIKGDAIAPLTVGVPTFGTGWAVIQASEIPALIFAPVNGTGVGNMEWWNAPGSRIAAFSRDDGLGSGGFDLATFASFGIQTGRAGSTNTGGNQDFFIDGASHNIGVGTNIASRKLTVAGIIGSQDGTNEATVAASAGRAMFGSDTVPIAFTIGGASKATIDTNGTLDVPGGITTSGVTVGVTNVVTELANKAPSASPLLTGITTLSNPSAGYVQKLNIGTGNYAFQAFQVNGVDKGYIGWNFNDSQSGAGTYMYIQNSQGALQLFDATTGGITISGGATTASGTFKPSGGYLNTNGVPGITTTWTNMIPGVITQRISTVNGLVSENVTL